MSDFSIQSTIQMPTMFSSRGKRHMTLGSVRQHSRCEEHCEDTRSKLLSNDEHTELFETRSADARITWNDWNQCQYVKHTEHAVCTLVVVYEDISQLTRATQGPSGRWNGTFYCVYISGSWRSVFANVEDGTVASTCVIGQRPFVSNKV